MASKVDLVDGMKREVAMRVCARDAIDVAKGYGQRLVGADGYKWERDVERVCECAFLAGMFLGYAWPTEVWPALLDRETLDVKGRTFTLREVAVMANGYLRARALTFGSRNG